MKVIVVYKQVEYKNQLAEMIQHVLIEQNMKAQYLEITKCRPNDFMAYLKNISAEIIISLDMAGFQFKTLQEDFFYNILTAKQLHFLSDENELNGYEQADFALNLYMAVPHEECENIVLTRMANIPHVIEHPDYEKNQGAIIYSESNIKTIEEIIALFLYDLR